MLADSTTGEIFDKQKLAPNDYASSGSISTDTQNSLDLMPMFYRRTSKYEAFHCNCRRRLLYKYIRWHSTAD